MNFLRIWFWESLENIPLLLGFIFTVRLWDEHLLAGLIVLVFGMGFGVLVTRWVEPNLHKTHYAVSWKSALMNFFIFVLLAIPFVYYFLGKASWLNWKTDLVAGISVGALMSYLQSLHWQGQKSRILLHGLAMTIATPLIVSSIRWIVQVDAWNMSILWALLLTLFASLLIVLIDYQEMYLGKT